MLNTIHDRHRGTRRRAGRTGAIAAALGMALLSGCQQARQSLSIGDMHSAYNREIWWMSLWAIALSIIIFIGVSYALFYTVNKFREDKHDAEPAQFHGNNRLEVALVVVPVIIVFGLSVLAVKSLAVVNNVDASAPKIDVLGKQFWWNFSYPDATAAAGGVVTNGNEMLMPAAQKITLSVTSGDVIHGFWAPNIGGQRAAMPATKKVWMVDSDRAGAYQGNCSQLCGGSHANMRYKVVVLDKARYDSTVSAMQAYKAPEPAPGSSEARGYALFMQGKPSAAAPACASCHRVQGTPAAGAVGPDLSFFGTRRTLGAGIWEAMTEAHWTDPKAAAELHAWIKHSPAVKPGSLMPSYDGSEYRSQGKLIKGGTLTDAEIDDIAAYLRSLQLPADADYWKGTPVIGANTAGGPQ
ncbi:cytochrome c oxidase subunit II [Deinococcus sp. KSM4-11]|uniref:cytochrome c oxidase subunit II n=1 Tax=Deinococcus sp. KSM4-11 TaxID=2568654 RepID=UPI0010A3632E|nr:cytochrome c oxidase subunit II [Deinococcus sp. KSM4-11]THF84986.1 cytochrome c oxidase subunit II [Deinococcus sp. KSM4-11]